MFQYLGNLRFQGWFETPNVCAAFLCMTILFTLGLQYLTWRHKKTYFKILSWVFGSAVIIQLLLLAATYSRGGYVSIFLALGFVWYLIRGKLILLYAIILLITIFLIGNGADRVASIGEVSNGSISHRLLLWKGGLGIIAKYPIAGEPTGRPGAEYCDWYRPLWVPDGYSHFINDYLSIGALYGIFALFGCLAVIALVIWLGIKSQRVTKNRILACWLGGIITYLVGTIFSTFYIYSETFWGFATLLILCCLLVSYIFWRKRIKFNCRDVIMPLGITITICLGILIAGTVVNGCLPYSYKKVALAGENSYLYQVKPPHDVRIKANLIYLFTKPEMMNNYFSDEISLAVRPLVLRKFTVITAAVDSGTDGLKVAKQTLEYAFSHIKNNQPIFIVGMGDGAKQGLLASIAVTDPRLKGIIAVGMPASWPWKELSPIDNIVNCKVPILLIHGADDEVYSVDEAKKLKAFADKYKLPLRLKIIEHTGHAFENRRGTLFDLIEEEVRSTGSG